MTRSFRPADAGASGIQPESAAAQVDSASDSGTGTSRRRLLAGAGVMSLAGLAATMVDNGSASASVPATPTVPLVEGTAAASPWPKLKFVGARHGQFQLNGKPWHWGGTNCYYLHAQSHYMIDSMLNDAKAMSMQVVRAWAFFDGNTIGALQTGPYEYDEANFDSLDYAVYKAGQLGIRLVLPLVNNWPDYGGMQQYVKWFLDLPDDSYAAAVNHDRFYSDTQIRRCYLAYAAHVINRRNRYTGLRYKDDPTIMTWELANEPRNRSDPSGKTILRWADEVSRAIKHLAPRQLVAIGDEGLGLSTGSTDYPYSTYEGNRWLALSSLKAVDYATVHLYPQGWGRNASNGVDAIAWGSKWISDHIALGRTTLHKPVVIEEFGLKIEAATGIPDAATRDRGYDAWLTEVEASGGAATQFWILTALTDAGIPYGDYDGFRVVYPSDTATLLTRHALTLGTTVH
jgi:mannan endo-1,4-beta-mannosidase